MKQAVSVHGRVHERRPDIAEGDVLAAWGSRICCQARTSLQSPQYLAVGFDRKGRALQMVAAYDPKSDRVLIFYAMQVTAKALRELGLD